MVQEMIGRLQEMIGRLWEEVGKQMGRERVGRDMGEGWEIWEKFGRGLGEVGSSVAGESSRTRVDYSPDYAS